jgi:hypothetical protein
VPPKNNKKKKTKISRAKLDWGSGLSSKVSALQALSPEFKPQSYQKKKKKE